MIDLIIPVYNNKGGLINTLHSIDYTVFNVIIVEDIIDTGKTLDTVVKLFKHRGAASVKIVTLLNKPSRRTVEVKGDYIGFEVENEFVVGFGLDFNQRYRCLPYVGVLKDECYHTKVPYWVHVILFLCWGWLMYRLWVWIDKRK